MTHNRPEDGFTVVHCRFRRPPPLLTLGSKVRIWSNWISTLMAADFLFSIIRQQLVGDDSRRPKAGF